MAPIGMALQAVATAMAPPVPLTAMHVVERPTAAARAVSVEGVGNLPATAVSFTFQCLYLDIGLAGDCIAAEDGGTTDRTAFLRRMNDLWQVVATDPMRRAALAMVAFYRLPLSGRRGATRSVLIRETVSAADAPPSGPAIALVAKGEMRIAGPAADLRRFYPRAALRAGAQARVSATCRVLADRSLWCRDAHVEVPAITGEQPMWRAPALDSAFEQATIKALAGMKAFPKLASGGDSAGREARLTVNWALP